MAATLETAARGVIYEHTPQCPPAQALANELKTMLDEMREQGAKVYDREAAIALRAIEQGARETHGPDRRARRAYLDLMAGCCRSTGQRIEPAPPGGPAEPADSAREPVMLDSASVCRGVFPMKGSHHGEAVRNLR